MLTSPNEVELSSVPPEIAIAGSLEILKDPEIWICNTSASNHLTFAKVGCLAERPSETQSQGIFGPARKVESEIDLLSIVCDRFGNALTKVTSKEVLYKGDSNFNLFLVGICLIDDWKLSGDAGHIQLSKGGVDIKFDIVIRMKKGALFCCLIKQIQGFETAAAATEGGKQTSLEKAHYLLGHPNHHSTIDTAKHLEWGQLKNSGKVCQSCAGAKTKQKTVPQTRREPKSSILSEIVYHDLATMKAPANVVEKVPKPDWQVFVDEATGMKFCTFHKFKDDILEDTSAQLKAMEHLANREIQIWRQDNAGENKALEENMKGEHWSMKTKIEYTAPGTPQQNSYTKMGFTALACRARAMMNMGNVPRGSCYKLFS